MTKSTLHPEQPFPELLATSLAGESIDISKPGGKDWRHSEWKMPRDMLSGGERLR